MSTVQQFRSKALEYDALLRNTRSPDEISEYRDRRQSYTSLADNLDWLAANSGKTVAGETNYVPDVARKKRRSGHVEEEAILRCLGAAVILNWNTIPTKLQRALFEAASDIRGVRNAPLKDVLARFLHDHKNDSQRQQQSN